MISLPLMAVMPLAGGVTPVMVRASSSGSLSLASTEIVTGVSSSVMASSSTATGTSLTSPTVTVTSSTAVSSPSEAVMVKLPEVTPSVGKPETVLPSAASQSDRALMAMSTEGLSTSLAVAV